MVKLTTTLSMIKEEIAGNNSLKVTKKPKFEFMWALAVLLLASFAVNWEEEPPHGNFIRPFKGLSNQKLVSFLSENPSLPVSLDDLRFFRYSAEHERLVRFLIVPSLYDQRATLVFARLHSHSHIRIDPALDKLIDSIDETSWVSFLFFIIVSPSYPLYETILKITSESSLDEWFQCFFLLLSCIEATQFLCFLYEIHLDHGEYGKHPKFSFMRAIIAVASKFFIRAAIVSLLTAVSYRILWWCLPTPVLLLVSNALIFALPAWYVWHAYRSIKRSMKYLNVLKNGTTKEQLKRKIEEVQLLKSPSAELKKSVSDLDKDIADQERILLDIQRDADACSETMRVLGGQKETLQKALAVASTDTALQKQLQADFQAIDVQLATCDTNLKVHKAALEKAESLKHSIEIAKERLVEQLKLQVSNMQLNPVFIELIAILKTKTIQSDKLEFIKILGAGGFCAVYHAQMYGVDVAVKMSVASSEHAARNELMYEVMSRCDHAQTAHLTNSFHALRIHP